MSAQSVKMPLIASPVSDSGHSSSSGRCRDPFFALLFCVQVGALLYFSIVHGVNVFGHESGERDGDFKWIEGGSAVWTLCISVCFGTTLCVLWLWKTTKDPEGMIALSFKAWATLYVVGAILFVAVGLYWGALVCVLGLLGLWCVWRAVRDRLAFAAANLGVACAALKVHPSSFGIVLLGMVASVAWAFLWAAGALGVIKAVHGDGDEGGGNVSVNPGVGFLLLVSFYWGGLVASNVGHVAVSGTVASWWFHPEDAQDPGACRSALWRASTSSFGSVCFGSLLVAVLEAVRACLRNATDQAQRRGQGVMACCLCCLECLLRQVERWVQYINKFAFTYVAIYGDDFLTAGRRVRDLFTKRGFWNTVLNDFVLERVFFMGVLGIACSTGAATCATARLAFGFDPHQSLLLALCGLGVGLLLANVATGCLASGVATVYVAFAEKPDALQRNHPREFDALYQGWHHAYPAACAFVTVVERP